MTARIYADFNGLQRLDGGKRLVVPLASFGSLCDLANAGIVLTEGLRLTIHDKSDESEDLEADATAHFDDYGKYWVAEIDTRGYRYVPTQNAKRPPLVCVGCRTSLEDFVHKHGLNNETKCPECGVFVWSPVLPPLHRRKRAD
jgi:hypothetical protein